MNLQQYLKRKSEQDRLEQGRFRTPCPRCLQAPKTCYCRHIQSFDPKIRFAILIHKLEMRKRIATGRMSHLCLKKSQLIDGYDYSLDERVNSIIHNPLYHSVILFPGTQSTNLTSMLPGERAKLFPKEKELVVFVMDGTWSTAKKSLRRSRNLHALPQICFTSNRPSNFRVRKQPKENCFSTLEAIYQTIDLLGESAGFDTGTREHNRLLHVFDQMVEQQLEFIRISHQTQRHSRHRRQLTPRN